MERIIGPLFVGSDTDYQKLKDADGWSILRCAKEGSGGHRSTLGYSTKSAPEGEHYLSISKGNRLALNFIDAKDPNFIPLPMIEAGIEYIKQRLAAGDKVLVACNQGHSRGPTTAMLFLRSIGELPYNFVGSEKVFSTLYPDYQPSIGLRQFAKSHWHTFAPQATKENHER